MEIYKLEESLNRNIFKFLITVIELKKITKITYQRF